MVANSASVSDAPVADSVAIRLNGRIFPRWDRDADVTSPAPGSDASQADEQPFPETRSRADVRCGDSQRAVDRFDHSHPSAQEPTLRSRLADDLWQRLPFSRVTSLHRHDRSTVVKAYVESLALLNRFVEDARRLIHQVCETNLEFRQRKGSTYEAKRDACLYEKLNEMVGKTSFAEFIVPNALEAKLVARSLKEIRSALESALRQAVNQFSNRLFSSFEQFVDARVMGLIQWAPSDVCQYHFFKEVLIQENDGTRVRHGRERQEVSRSRQTTTVMTRQLVKETTSGRTIHRLARHEHHVMNAFHTSVADSKVVIPQNIQPLLDAIPDWLYPFVRIVDGEIFRERIVEQDYRVEQWKDEQRREIVRTEVFDSAVYGREPAVIIGDLVLTGWGPREIEAEQQRRAGFRQHHHQNEMRAAAASRSIHLIAVAVLAELAACLLFLRGFKDSQDFHVASFAVTFVGVLAAVLAVKYDAQARGAATHLLCQVCAATTVLSAALAVHFAIASYWMSSLLFGLVTPFLLAIALFAARLTWVYRRS